METEAVAQLLARWKRRVLRGEPLAPAECLWLLDTTCDLLRMLAAVHAGPAPAGAAGQLAVGTRVQVRAAEPDVELASDEGIVIGRDELGYYRVWLAAPARHRGARGWQALPVVCVAADQLRVLAAPRPVPAGG
jgi:hypothetical protein